MLLKKPRFDGARVLMEGGHSLRWRLRGSAVDCKERDQQPAQEGESGDRYAADVHDPQLAGSSPRRQYMESHTPLFCFSRCKLLFLHGMTAVLQVITSPEDCIHSVHLPGDIRPVAALAFSIRSF